MHTTFYTYQPEFILNEFKLHVMKKITLLACITCYPIRILARSDSVSGGDAIGPEGSVTYSVGQTFYTTNTAATSSVSQGCNNLLNLTKDFIILKVSPKIKH
jgi:hypothetical protein